MKTECWWIGAEKVRGGYCFRDAFSSVSAGNGYADETKDGTAEMGRRKTMLVILSRMIMTVSSVIKENQSRLCRDMTGEKK